MFRSSNVKMAVSAALVVTLLSPVAWGETEISAQSLLARQTDVVQSVGIVRYFHPHDDVSSVDWNKVLLSGFDIAETARNDQEFSSQLAGMLSGIGHGVSQLPGGSFKPVAEPLDCGTQQPVRWIHEGLGASPGPGMFGPYASKRNSIKEKHRHDPHAWTVLIRAIPAEPYIGEKLIFSGKLRLPDGGEGVLWVRVDSAKKETLVFDNMNEQRVSGAEWHHKGLYFKVPRKAEQIVFGTVIYGIAPGEFRDIQLRRYDEGSGTPMGKSLITEPERWYLNSSTQGFEHSVEVEEGAANIKVTLPDIDWDVPDTLLSKYSEAPNHWLYALPDGSDLVVPMALCRSQATTGSLEENIQPSLEKEKFDLSELPAHRLAQLDVATLWPVIQHFYPYRESLQDWNGVLQSALREAGRVDDRNAHKMLLQKMMAQIHDGHVQVNDVQDKSNFSQAFLPIALEHVENQLVVALSNDRDLARPGDIVVSINGEPTKSWLARTRALQSGSEHWRTNRAIEELLRDKPKNRVRLGLMRDGKLIKNRLTYLKEEILRYPVYPAYERLEDDRFYVNLAEMTDESMAELIPQLAKSNGVIFDLRGYPKKLGYEFFGHFLQREDQYQNWMKVMAAQAPNGSLIVASEHDWRPYIEPATPKVTAPAIFLVGPRTMSYAESITGLVKANNLGVLVGSQTAGANGNYLPIDLPGGFATQFTGMVVFGPDGKPFHGEGISPDIHVVPTIQGLAQGRDEVRERAIAVLASNSQ